MKKIVTCLVVFLATLAVLSAAGAPEATAAKGEKITLTVWHIGVDATRHETITSAIARYEALI